MSSSVSTAFGIRSRRRRSVSASRASTRSRSSTSGTKQRLRRLMTPRGEPAARRRQQQEALRRQRLRGASAAPSIDCRRGPPLPRSSIERWREPRRIGRQLQRYHPGTGRPSCDEARDPVLAPGFASRFCGLHAGFELPHRSRTAALRTASGAGDRATVACATPNAQSLWA